MPYTIILELNPSSTDIQVLGDGIIDFAREVTHHQPMEFFACFIRDDHNEILGGCNGSTLYGCLYIDQLWVSPELRSQGYGRQLVEKALAFGISKKCSFATVNTMNWEALGFYQKLGFEIEFQRTGFEHNSVFYFLRKPLICHKPTPTITENTHFPWKQDEILYSIVQELKHSYHCHTIILYGSRARGDYTAASDYDVAGFADNIQEKQWLARFDDTHQVFLDIFIFPEKDLRMPNESHIQMSDGVVLIERDELGTRVLEKLKILISNSPSLNNTERCGRSVWYQKMLSRAKVGDMEGHYRQIWMIHSLLEDYFAFRNLRFLGPKKAFQHLQEHDKKTLVLFETVLNNPIETSQLKELIDAVTQHEK